MPFKTSVTHGGIGGRLLAMIEVKMLGAHKQCFKSIPSGGRSIGHTGARGWDAEERFCGGEGWERKCPSGGIPSGGSHACP